MPVTLVLALSLAACGTDESSENDGAQTPTTAAAPVTSGAGSADMIAHGTLLDRGKPVSGAKVFISLWPDTTDTKVGESFRLWDSEEVTTDSHGNWFLNLDPATIPSKFWPAGEEFLNIDLQVIDSPRVLRWSTTVYSVGDKKVWRTEGARVGDPVLKVKADIGTEKITLTDSREDSEMSDAIVIVTKK
jgi:hypothetical protein